MTSDGSIVAFDAARAMLRIQFTPDGTRVVLTISGRLDAESLSTLRRSLDIVPEGQTIVLDLADLVLADCEGVRFLGRWETRGRIVLRNCPAYIRTWIAAEDAP